MNLTASTSRRRWPSCGHLPGCLGLFVLACWAGLTPPARADKLDAELVKGVYPVMQHILDKGYKNVGVLKFRVAKGKSPLSFNVGPLNSNLADRVENLLILYDNPAKPFGVIKNASQVAIEKKLVPYTSPKGLSSLFEESYPLAWGDARVKPDAFVTGIVRIGADMTGAVVTLGVLDRETLKNKKSLEFTKITEFKVEMDRTLLGDIGQSFLVQRSLLKRRDFTPEEGDKEAAKDAADRDDNKTPPTQSKENYLELTILYDGKPQNPTPDPNSGGKLRVPEPQEGQKVVFGLKNISDVTIGVVLKVNGLSTWQGDTNEPLKCSKWIMDKNEGFKIPGIYQDAENYQPFKVLSAAESEAKSFTQYLGMIHAHVFITGQKMNFAPGTTDPDAPMNIARKLSLRTRGLPPGQKTARPRTLADLQAQLNESFGTKLKAPPSFTAKSRGYLDVEEKKQKDDVGKGALPNPVQVETVTIQYYQVKQ